LKWSGDNGSAMSILDGFDWSGSSLELQLAVACLREEWDNAAAIMQRVGPDSWLCPPHSFVFWPVFRDFRKTQQFLDSFKAVFGVEFAEEVKKQNAETGSSEN
jgi:hypothetical protein